MRRLVALAHIGVTLRWRLVTNRARRLGKRSPVLALVVAALYALGTAYAVGRVRFDDLAMAERTAVLHLSSLVFGWVFGPILIGGVDETVDPTRLALLPLRRSELFTVQVAAALSGIGPLSAAIGLGLGLPIGFGTSPGAAVVGVICALTVVLMIVGLARSVAALLTLAQRSRIGRDLGILIAAFLGGGMFVVAQLASRLGGERAKTLLDGLAWAPWGWPARALTSARAGSWGTASFWLLWSALATAAALWLWAKLSETLLTSGERSVRPGRKNSGPVLHGATSVFGAALARQMIYVRRSPNTRVALLFGIAFGVAFPILQILQHGANNVEGAAFGCLLAMLVNVGAAANLLGFDAGSLWLEVLCGGPNRAHMVARSVAVLPNLLIPTWIAAIVVGIWTGQFRYVALVALVAIPVALIVLAEGVVTSLVAPFPLPDGDNPFGNRQASEGRGIRIAMIALGGLLSIVVVSSPVVVAAFLGRDSAAGWIAAGAGVLWALLIDVAVIRWVGRYLHGREPELLSLLSPLAVN
jgi:ABC-2 type transport system permease protein